MKKKFYVIYCNDVRIAILEKKEDADKYVEFLDFFSFNDEDEYWYRKEFLCLK